MTQKRSFLTFSKTICLTFFTLTFLISATALPTFAYEEDTHFLMTYVICRSVGFTEQETLIVASVDQGMDDSKDTVAVTSKGKPQPLQEWLWHAIDKNGDMHAAGILGRRDALFNDALNDPDPRNRLIRLGIFFHYQQDTWAHRNHDKDDRNSPDRYTPVTTPEGHAPWGHQPDRPPYDPVAALKCLEDGIFYASTFLQESIRRTPTLFLKDYKPSGGLIDAAWKDDRQSPYFNQIAIAGLAPNSPRLFLASLIRSQIDTYGAAKNNLRYFNKLTAKEAELPKVAAVLRSVCNAFKTSVGTIQLPLQTDKPPEFQRMTTVGLLSLRPGSL